MMHLTAKKRRRPLAPDAPRCWRPMPRAMILSSRGGLHTHTHVPMELLTHQLKICEQPVPGHAPLLPRLRMRLVKR